MSQGPERDTRPTQQPTKGSPEQPISPSLPDPREEDEWRGDFSDVTSPQQKPSQPNIPPAPKKRFC